MRGLDRWIEGDTRGHTTSEWRSARPERPVPANKPEPEPIGAIAKELQCLTADQLLARLRAVLKGK